MFASRFAVLVTGALLLVAPAKATTFFIVPTFDSSITSDPNAFAIESTIDATIAAYESIITTPITVRIKFSEMSSGLGENSTFFNQVSYSAYLAALSAHATDANDATALASLPADLTSIPDVASGAVIDLKTPNIRALGLAGGNVASDSTISLNTSLMNISSSGPQDSNKYDMMSVLMHEIDEVLGFGSYLDLVKNGSPTPATAIFPFDLYRYVAGSTTRSFTTSSAASSALSIDGGVTDLVAFNQDSSGDLGDFNSPTPVVQNAFGTPGAQPNLGVELTALDVLGYTLVSTPEPSTVGLMSLALLAMWKFKQKALSTPRA